VQTFNAPLLLKPWKVPKVVWPMLALAALFAAFAAYQVYSLGQMQQSSKRLKRQIAQLETQWKPVEQLQTRVGKFEEDRKTLNEFNQEGYPLLEILSILTQITPEDTWLNYFSIRKGQMVLRGESKSAIKYLSELYKVEGFGDVRFSSPVTRNPSSDLERFNVQVQIDVEKLKKTTESLGIHPLDSPAPDAKAESVAESPEPATAQIPPMKVPEKSRTVEEPEDTEDTEEVVEEEATEADASEEEAPEEEKSR